MSGRYTSGMIRRLPAAALAATALLAAGCGSGGDDKGTPKASPERAAYIAKLDAYCETTNKVATRLAARTARALQKGTAEGKGFAALVPVLDDGATEQRKALEGFLAIPTPAAEKDAIAPYVQTLRDQADAVDALAAATRKGDAAAFKTASERSQEIRAQSEKLAREYGFKVCSAGSAPTPKPR